MLTLLDSKLVWEETLQVALTDILTRYRVQFRPIGQGKNRICLAYSESEVIKIPLNQNGIDDNYYEAKLSGRTDPDGVCYAVCRIHMDSHIPLLRMERVVPILEPSEKLDWAIWVDCGQVGRNQQGRVVAYDFGRW